MKVPLLDLKPQYHTLKKELDEAVLKVAESQYFILGPQVESFENKTAEYLKANRAIGVSSGTDALLLALMALDIKPGDEVIVPTYSFFATAGVVARLNAVPVFTDVDPVTYNMIPEDFEKKITNKTKAVIPVHLYGQSADMDKIVEIAKAHNIYVVEDGAQAIGVEYKDGKKVGTIGDIGCYSYFPSKNLGGYGDAGMIVTMDEELGEKIKIMRVHGMQPKYYHPMIGGNFRIDAIQAAVLEVKLPHLDNWSEKRRENAALYNRLFRDAGIATANGLTEYDETNKVLLPKAVYENSGVTNFHIYNQYIIRTKQRDELKKFLIENSVGCDVYYPVPFHRQECFGYLGCKDEDYPNSNVAAEETLALPIYPDLTTEQIEYVVETISRFIKG